MPLVTLPGIIVNPNTDSQTTMDIRVMFAHQPPPEDMADIVQFVNKLITEGIITLGNPNSMGNGYLEFNGINIKGAVQTSDAPTTPEGIVLLPFEMLMHKIIHNYNQDLASQTVPEGARIIRHTTRTGRVEQRTVPVPAKMAREEITREEIPAAFRVPEVPAYQFAFPGSDVRYAVETGFTAAESAFVDTAIAELSAHYAITVKPKRGDSESDSEGDSEALILKFKSKTSDTELFMEVEKAAPTEDARRARAATEALAAESMVMVGMPGAKTTLEGLLHAAYEQADIKRSSNPEVNARLGIAEEAPRAAMAKTASFMGLPRVLSRRQVVLSSEEQRLADALSASAAKAKAAQAGAAPPKSTKSLVGGMLRTFSRRGLAPTAPDAETPTPEGLGSDSTAASNPQFGAPPPPAGPQPPQPPKP